MEKDLETVAPAIGDTQDTPVVDTSKRALLKGAAAVAGTAGVQAITGFPMIWAQEIKNIELRHVGVSYSVVKAIGDQASKDLGFKVTMQNVDTSAAINRFVTQPNSVDIADVEGWQAKLATKRGVLQGIERRRIKEFDNILPIFTKGEIGGKTVSRQGISPYEAMYISKPDATELHEGVADWMTFLPQVYNADSIGYRPDLIKREVTEWKDLINPAFKGKAAILDVPAIGIMDAALCFESAGEIKYGNKGNMTRSEIDFTINKLIELKKDGHFRATWTTFDQSVQLMAAGEVIIQSMWSPAVAAVRVKGMPCVYAPVNIKNGKEGYRGWCNGLGLMRHLERQEARGRLRVHQLVLHRLAGRLRRALRLLQPGALHREEAPHRERVGLLVRGQGLEGRHPRSVRRADGEGRCEARRRLVHGPCHQHLVLEHADGRGAVHEQALERFQGRLTPQGHGGRGSP